jgi:RNA polymerase sigma factor (sigma-70 family)
LASDCAAAVTKQIHALFHNGTAVGLTDDSLLDRFRSGPADEAEAAFAVLVQRHGPAVWHVCRRILGHRHDAEDAAQATFLVLARQAHSIRHADSVGSWLYGVAARIAARARLDAARRRRRERRGVEVSMAIRHGDSGDPDGSETWPELYEELARLPERFRLPIVFCHLEGLTHEQAAIRLGCPVRTIESRLARARERLRDRLARRGVAPAVAALTAALTPDATSAAGLESWAQGIETTAIRFAAGGTAATLIPATAAVLARGVSRAMNFHRLTKWAAALLLIAAAAGTGMAVLARSAPPEQGRQAPPEANKNPYRATLAHGASLEVVAVSSVPSGANTWWRPDGVPLGESPADPLAYPYRVHADEEIRAILVRVSDLPQEATLKWMPTYDSGYAGYSPTKHGQKLAGLEAYVVSLRRDRETCEVKVKLAGGAWTTDASNDGRGGTGFIQNGHKFDWGKAREYAAHGRSMTAIAVAHNVIGRDRRLIAIDRDGETHPAVYSSGLSGEVLCILDAEFPLPPDRIKEYQFQSRPFENALIPGIALRPRGNPAAPNKSQSGRRDVVPKSQPLGVGEDRDSDGDGLSDFQEIHKYGTNPQKISTADDGVCDGDPQRRREFTYTIRTVVKVMTPVNLECLDDDYQDARVVSRGENFVELEVIHYPLNTNAIAIRGNPDWRRDAESQKEFLRPGITTNWDDAMRRDLIAALKADGIDPDRLDDEELVRRASAWLFANTKYVNMFCTHYMHYPEGSAAIYPGLHARFDSEKGDRGWTVQEQLDHELFGRSMFANRTHGSCTSSAVLLTTALRALGIPSRMVLGIPMVDGNDSEQLAMVAKGIHHHRARQTLLQGLTGTKGYANHTFNEVFVGGRWARLNYAALGQNTLDGKLMGLLTHVNTFNDLSEVPLAATWGKRYALGERDSVFRFGNAYRCEHVSDHFGKFAKIENPEARAHRSLTVSRAYWADDADAHATIKEAKWLFHKDGSRSLLIHADEWFDEETGRQYRPFLEAAAKEYLLRADGCPDVHGRITTASITWHTRNLHEIEVIIPREEYAKMVPGVEYTLAPRNEVAGYEWRIRGRVTITKNP